MGTELTKTSFKVRHMCQRKMIQWNFENQLVMEDECNRAVAVRLFGM